MDRGEPSNPPPYKELWKQSLVGQTIDAKLNSIYEGLGEIQKLIIEKVNDKQYGKYITYNRRLGK